MWRLGSAPAHTACRGPDTACQRGTESLGIFRNTPRNRHAHRAACQQQSFVFHDTRSSRLLAGWDAQLLVNTLHRNCKKYTEQQTWPIQSKTQQTKQRPNDPPVHVYDTGCNLRGFCSRQGLPNTDSARKHNARLYVYTRDTVWSHDPCAVRCTSYKKRCKQSTFSLTFRNSHYNLIKSTQKGTTLTTRVVI